MSALPAWHACYGIDLGECLQGEIVATDGQNITLRMMDGYPAPNVGGRLMFFNATGALQPMYQVCQQP